MSAGRNRQIGQLKIILYGQFPKLFSYEHPLPLAMGIHREIQEQFPTLPLKVVNVFLRRWTSRNHYLVAMANARSVRHHLDGNVSERVSKEHREFAAATIKERRQKEAAKT